MKRTQPKTSDESVHIAHQRRSKKPFFGSRTDSGNSFFRPAVIQTSLKIGKPDDKFEQQADHVADNVVNTSVHDIQAQEMEEEEELQMKPVAQYGENSTGYAPSGVSRQIQNSGGGGSPLTAHIGREMSQKIGADFSNVSVHTGTRATEMNEQLGARAFTYGKDVYFNSGEYSPETSDGKHLLAHELTHVVQQGAADHQKQTDRTADAAGSVSDIQAQEMEEEEELQMKKKADHDFKQPVHQKKPLIIQKQEVEVPSPDADDNSFEFDYELLPPELKFTLGNWMLESNTGSTELQFTQGLFKYSFGYKYGSELFAGLKTPGFGTRLGVNPDSLETSLGVSSGAFRFGGSLNPETGSAGVNLGYGSPLQPMPWELQESVMGGWSGMSSTLQGLGSMQDPISYYLSHKGDIDSVMKAVKAVQKSTDEESYSFGAGLKFKYNPDTGFLIHGGMQWKF